MNEAFDQALDRILAGDEGLLEGFGLERLSITGLRTGSGIHEWEDRLQVGGAGQVRLTTHRSLGDASGQEAGLFELTRPRQYLLDLIRLVRRTGLDKLPPFRIEPVDILIRLTVVAGGAVQVTPICFQDPDALEPVRELINELARLSFEATQHPVYTLGLTLELPPRARTGKVRLAAGLGFRNSGRTGYWLRHPAALADDGRLEQRALFYGLQPQADPDVTPLPIEIHRAPLTPERGEAPSVMWVPPESEIAMQFQAELEFPSPGRYLARAVYSTYDGELTLGGQPRFLGGVFSPEVELEVR